jgi:hypothetical protein
VTLTAALRAALAEPADLEPLRAIVAHVATNPSESRRGLVASLLRYGVESYGSATISHGRGHAATVVTLTYAGGDIDDLRTVCNEPAVAPEIPRSAEWASAAERLAAWADGVAS